MKELSLEEGLFQRQTLYAEARRVVLKVGSAVLTGERGIDEAAIARIAAQLAFLKNTGREVILVTSGAVAAGRRRLGREKTPNEPLKVKQALAATGQGLLMQAYEQAFARLGLPVAQVLLTHADLSNRRRYLNARNTLFTLFEFGVIPIINENDTVSAEELRFSDNDTLAALMTNMIGADMLIILSDVDGLYTGNPPGRRGAGAVFGRAGGHLLSAGRDPGHQQSQALDRLCVAAPGRAGAGRGRGPGPAVPGQEPAPFRHRGGARPVRRGRSGALPGW